MTELDNWLKRSPYRRWIPLNWRETEPKVAVFVSAGEDAKTSYPFGLVMDEFFPALTFPMEEEEVELPEFVADLLVWYCDGDASDYLVEVVPYPNESETA